MPAIATIKQISYQAFMICLTDRELFSTLVREDVRELGYAKSIVALVGRLGLILFDHWMAQGVEVNYFPEAFLDLYSQAVRDN